MRQAVSPPLDLPFLSFWARYYKTKKEGQKDREGRKNEGILMIILTPSLSFSKVASNDTLAVQDQSAVTIGDGQASSSSSYNGGAQTTSGSSLTVS